MLDEVKKMVAADETLNAITHLINWLQGKNNEAENELILLSARYENNQRKIRSGLVNDSEASLADNQLRMALLELIDQLEAGQDKKDTTDPTTSAPQKHKILFLEANPYKETNLDSNIESREISNVFRDHPKRDQFQLVKEFAVTKKLLLRVVNEEKPSLVHLSCYSDQNGLFLHSDSDEPDHIANDIVEGLIDLFDHSLKCIFFNTWVAELMAQKISQNGQIVLGYNDMIDNVAAIAFATGFYQSIAFGKDYITSFGIAYKTMIQSGYGKEASKPFLYSNGVKHII